MTSNPSHWLGPDEFINVIDTHQLRQDILDYLKQQGFKYNPHIRPSGKTKGTYRRVQQASRLEQINLHSKLLKRAGRKVEPFIRNGSEIEPSSIDLELREVLSGSLESYIFNWWNLVWWRMPYQRPYGRQIRFLLWDRGHDTPFGLISFQSPVLRMAVRDKFLEIPNEERDVWVNRSLQAQRIGAFPPYNYLLGGKMCALAIVCDEIRNRYKEKYAGATTLLEERTISDELLFMTTTSGFGRSSIYNRLRYEGEQIATSLGYTKGAGSFHISEALYQKLISLLSERGFETGREFGNGPSRKMKLIKKGLSELGIQNGVFHNVPREFFLFPLVSNLKEVIKGIEDPEYCERPFSDLAAFWKKRYAIPRSVREEVSANWRTFKAKTFFKKASRLYEN